MKKEYVWIVLFLVVVGSLFWWWSLGMKPQIPLLKNKTDSSNTENQTGSPVIGTKNYTSSQWGFSLSYPSTWSYLQRSGGSTTPFGVLFSDQNLEDYSPAPGSVLQKSVNLVLYQTSLSVEEYSSKDLATKKALVESKENITVDGQQGVFVKATFNSKPYITALFKKGEYIYILESVVPTAVNVPEIENVIREMVRSYKFTS